MSVYIPAPLAIENRSRVTPVPEAELVRLVPDDPEADMEALPAHREPL